MAAAWSLSAPLLEDTRPFTVRAADYLQQTEINLNAFMQGVQGFLQPGWRVEPFGSYVQGLCILGDAIDVALVPSTEAPWPTAAQDLATMLCQMTNVCEILPPLCGKDDEHAPLRLQFYALTAAGPVPTQIIHLYNGDEDSGRLDREIRRLVDLDPRVRPFLLFMKNWVKTCEIAPSVQQGGAFSWTVMGILFLQQQGVLPAMKAFCLDEEGLGRSAPRAVPLWEELSPRQRDEWMLGFCDFMMDFLLEMRPGYSASIWTGQFVEVEGSFAFGSSSPRLGTAPTQLKLWEELLDLRCYLQLTTQGPDLGFLPQPEATTAVLPPSSLGAPPGLELEQAPLPASFETPPRPAKPAQKGSSSWQAAESHESGKAPSSKPDTAQPQTPSTAPPSASVSSGSRAAMDASLAKPSSRAYVMTATPLPPGEVKRGAGATSEEAETSHDLGLGSEGQLAWWDRAPFNNEERRDRGYRAPRWEVARSFYYDTLLEEVQLDKETFFGRGEEPALLENRLQRREVQLTIGKATVGYRLWFRHWLEHGRAEGDPKTPRVTDFKSKSTWESAYAEWRRSLHNPPASELVSEP